VYFVAIQSSGTSFLFVRVLLFLGAFAPSLVALGLTARDDGVPGVKTLLRRLFIWRVGARWYLFAVFYMPAIVLAVGVGYGLITQSWFPLNPMPRLALVSTIAFRATSRLFVRASEEIGWRGYALPGLAQRFGLGRASLILGPLWAAWHLPLFINPMSPNYRNSFPLYVLGVTALSVVFAWLYAKTGGSLLLVTLMHSAIAEALLLLPTPPTLASPFAFPIELASWLSIGVLWMSAGYLLARMPRSSAQILFPEKTQLTP
jgi:uncharacterized protein